LDPITGASDTWRVTPPPEGQAGAVYDVHSGAEGNDREGRPYVQW
jgi:hypothetical protein